MKTHCRVFLPALGFLAAWVPAQAVVPEDTDVGDWGLGGVVTQTQTDAGITTPDANPYFFQAFVDHGTTSAVTNPQIAVPPGPTLYNLGNDTEYNFGIAYRSAGVADAAALAAAYPLTNGYSLNFGTSFNNYTMTSLELTGASFPSVTPEITGGGTWSGGVLLVDVTDANNFITVNSFTGMQGGTDLIIFDAYSTVNGDYHSLRSASKNDGGVFYLGPNQLTGVPYFTLGDTYTGSITFLKVFDEDLSGVWTQGDDRGYAFMASRTYFTFQAIPEPSTYALLAVGLGWLMMRRRRTV